jgi:hypothetical protein
MRSDPPPSHESGVVNRDNVYICADCHHALSLHERDEENRVCACCVEDCECGHEPSRIVYLR